MCLNKITEVIIIMKKVELVEAVAEATGLTKADATRAIDATFAAITGALKDGDKVPLVGFGTFAVSKRAAREGRNPQTGETVKIAARNAVTFKAGSALKDAVN
jgi:DNA-binding protein HU-beta